MISTRARVLLIDDDEVDFVITRKLIAQLDRADYELDWAESYDAGLEILERGQHDVCLLDYRLGNQDGLGLLREVACRGVQIPMILLTAHGDAEVDRQALDMGAAGFLDKAQLDAPSLDRVMRYALKREGVVADLINQNSELLTLNRITRLAIAGDMNGVADEAARFMGLSTATIERLVPGEMLEVIGCYGVDDLPVGSKTPVQSALAKSVIDTGQPLLESATPEGGSTWMQTCACLAMHAQGEVVGALTFASQERLILDTTQVNRAAILADQIGELMSVSQRSAASH